MEDTQLLVIVDIDGTLSNWHKRAKRAGIAPPRHHRDRFQAWLDAVQNEESLLKDAAINPVISTVRALDKAGHNIIFLTGRSEKYKKVTERWLRKHVGRDYPLHMRSGTDFRSAADYKESKLKVFTKSVKGSIIAIDDDFDGDTTKVYEKMGILHLKVMSDTVK
jgi:hydroxymethylpyrimidine pyrophosphatase-like HAD family hydrolase